MNNTNTDIMNALTSPSDTEFIQCTKCKVKLHCTKFDLKRSGLRYRCCTDCRTFQKKYYSNHKCDHGKYAYSCKICCEQRKQNRVKITI